VRRIFTRRDAVREKLSRMGNSKVKPQKVDKALFDVERAR